jgi:hypothetical protein
MIERCRYGNVRRAGRDVAAVNRQRREANVRTASRREMEKWRGALRDDVAASEVRRYPV